MWKITREVGHAPLLSVTDSPVVVKNNMEMGYHILARKHLPPKFKDLLGEYKELSEKKYGDKFFCLNDLFYHLVCDELKQHYGEERFLEIEQRKDSEILHALERAEEKAKKLAEQSIATTENQSQRELSKVL